MKCANCGQEMGDLYPTKKFCSKNCAHQAYLKRGEDFYNYAPEVEKPLYEFDCAECGKRVEIYSRYDQRIKYCCGLCADKAKKRRVRQRLSKHRPENIGMSGGMSLVGLKIREARDLR